MHCAEHLKPSSTHSNTIHSSSVLMKLIVLTVCIGYACAEGRWRRQSSPTACGCASSTAVPVCQCHGAAHPSCQCTAAEQPFSSSCPCAIQAQADQCMPSCYSICQKSCQPGEQCQQICSDSCRVACQPILQSACSNQCLSSCQPQNNPACETACQNSCISDDQYAEQLIREMTYKKPGMLPEPKSLPLQESRCDQCQSVCLQSCPKQSPAQCQQQCTKICEPVCNSAEDKIAEINVVVHLSQAALYSPNCQPICVKSCNNECVQQTQSPVQCAPACVQSCTQTCQAPMVNCQVEPTTKQCFCPPNYNACGNAQCCRG